MVTTNTNGIYDESMISNTLGTVTSKSNYAPYAAAISTISNVVSGFQATNAFKDKLNAATDAAIKNAGNVTTSFELQQSQNREQIENINQVLGNKLSERGLQSLKESALLKAAAAETGTSGGTTEYAIKEAFINENMDKANIIASARQQTRNIFVGMNVSELSTKNQIDSILLGGGTNVSSNALIEGFSGGLGAITDTLAMIPMSERVNAFGIKPNGGNV